MVDMAEVINDWTRVMLKQFEELPDKAKELCFGAIFNLGITDKYMLDPIDECRSPIEKIFFVAFKIVENLRAEEIPDDYIGFHVLPQFDIVCDKHIYYADFMIVLENLIDPNKSYDLIVECDGHEFHERTKEQVKHDNERAYALKKHGEDILRFSGSQIYNEPIKCANDVFDYILARAKAV